MCLPELTLLRHLGGPSERIEDAPLHVTVSGQRDVLGTRTDWRGRMSRSDFVRAELKNDGDWFRPDHNSQTPGTPGREIRVLLIAGG